MSRRLRIFWRLRGGVGRLHNLASDKPQNVVGLTHYCGNLDTANA